METYSEIKTATSQGKVFYYSIKHIENGVKDYLIYCRKNHMAAYNLDVIDNCNTQDEFNELLDIFYDDFKQWIDVWVKYETVKSIQRLLEKKSIEELKELKNIIIGK